MLFVVKGGIIVATSTNTVSSTKPQLTAKLDRSGRVAYAIAISMFFPFMLFHSTNAAPTMLTAPAATLT
jgi:hypothetical protein